MLPAMRIFHREKAGRPIRALWTLEEAGVDYELVVMTAEEAAGDEHRARHPRGKVPVLETGGETVFESTALCLHAADLSADARLLGEPGSTERALVYQWLFFAMTEIEPPLIEAARTRESHPELAAKAVKKAQGNIDAVAANLGDRDFLVGDSFTVADIVMSEVLGIVPRFELGELTGALPAYVERMGQRPARVRAEARIG
ncbi:unannotated protein [freshwater metagenome]|uniref:Unannotated protein n=1 Tax=freshwater metagenome TaxID=449393 RepID=A0A6J7HLK3_9ZZZZ